MLKYKDKINYILTLLVILVISIYDGYTFWNNTTIVIISILFFNNIYMNNKKKVDRWKLMIFIGIGIIVEICVVYILQYYSASLMNIKILNNIMSIVTLIALALLTISCFMDIKSYKKEK